MTVSFLERVRCNHQCLTGGVKCQLTRICCWCRVDLVLVGAEGVVENGGVINKLGTYQIALAAAAHNMPFYVAAESYKVRLWLLWHAVRS